MLVLVDFGARFLFTLRAMGWTFGQRYALGSWCHVMLRMVALVVMGVAALKRLPMILKLFRWH